MAKTIRPRPHTQSSRPRSGTYWVFDRRQILCLVSARRHDLLDKLAAVGPLSIRELAPLVGASAASLYHHVGKLLKVGLVLQVGERTVKRKKEKVYGTLAPRMRLSRSYANPANRAVVDKLAAGLMRQIERDFRRGSRSPFAYFTGSRRNIGLARLVGAPSRQELARINGLFEHIAEILWASAGRKGPLVSVAWSLAPVLVRRTQRERAGS